MSERWQEGILSSADARHEQLDVFLRFLLDGEYIHPLQHRLLESALHEHAQDWSEEELDLVREALAEFASDTTLWLQFLSQVRLVMADVATRIRPVIDRVAILLNSEGAGYWFEAIYMGLLAARRYPHLLISQSST